MKIYIHMHTFAFNSISYDTSQHENRWGAQSVKEHVRVEQCMMCCQMAVMCKFSHSKTGQICLMQTSACNVCNQLQVREIYPVPTALLHCRPSDPKPGAGARG